MDYLNLLLKPKGDIWMELRDFNLPTCPLKAKTLLNMFFFFFLDHTEQLTGSVSQPGVEQGLPVVEAQWPNLWTLGESQNAFLLVYRPHWKTSLLFNNISWLLRKTNKLKCACHLFGLTSCFW